MNLKIAICHFSLTVFGVLYTATTLASAQNTISQSPKSNLSELSLEQLMDIEVTSVSRKAQRLSEAAAAVFVISQNDIRRSGATSLPEILRLAPGVQVARIDGNKWAVSIRGFDGRFANKLLVLMDARTIYTPLSSGVFWDIQDTVLEDIDRIEVIRGPGAALWGANAVNGVINIITKSAADTQGTLLSAGAGTQERGFATSRHGGNLGDKMHYRAYAKYFNRDGSIDAVTDENTATSKQARGQTMTEYRVKVAILRKLANFVKWPEGLTSSHFSTMGICIVGSDAFSKHLYTLSGQTVRGREVSVERVDDDRKLLPHCKIVFVSRSEHNRLERLLDNLNKQPVLTISDQDGFAEKGGMINLRVVKNKVRFEINVAAVNRSGISISAKLLRLATLVESNP